MITQLATPSPCLLCISVQGKLQDSDYKIFVPAAEAAIAASNGKARMLVRCDEFHGWDVHGAWDDLIFGIKHWMHFERIAVVGDKAWEKWMARIWKPVTKATVRYYDHADFEAARAWLEEGLGSTH